MNTTAKILIITGIALVLLGLLLAGKLGPLGHLPGDILIERENFTLFIPITTMVLVSLAATLAIWLFAYFS